MDLNELVAALGEIERAAHDFSTAPQSDAAGRHLQDVLRRRNPTLNEPYGFDRDTEALRRRVWTDCMAILSNLELASSPPELVNAQVQKLSTLVVGLLDLVRRLAETR